MRPRILLIDGVGRPQCYTELRAALDAEWLTELTPAIEREAASAIDLAVVSQENNPKTTVALCRLVERGIPTLCLIDGISEWRFIWANHEPVPGELSRPRHQPVLSHKVACIGRSQARLFESWGNLGRCEVVGLPRLDALRGRRPRVRPPGEPVRLLIATARMPAFTAGQLRLVEQSLQDLKAWIDGARSRGTVRIEPVWRLTFGLEATLGVRNERRDSDGLLDAAATGFSEDTGGELGRVLESVDAMVTTPSTCLLEGMLQSIPVALLDYHNSPPYVPAAWAITAPQHLDQVLPELASPPPIRMLHQDTILHDALECRTPAIPRLVRLIEAMIGFARECRMSGRPLAFPTRILADEQGGHHLPEERFDLGVLYPDHAVFDAMDRAALQAEVGHLRFRQEEQAREIAALKRRAAARGPMVWLRTAIRTVVPRGLWRVFPARRRPESWSQLPSWATPTRATRPPSPRGDREDPDG
jgi:hypothetical protein